MQVSLLLLLCLSVPLVSCEAEAFGVYGGSNQGCPATQPLPRSACKGRQSTCWSPGVRDTDCPAHGLCCFDGCVNTCAGQPALPPPLPPPSSSPLLPLFLPHPAPLTVLVPRKKRTTSRPRDPCNPSPCGPGTTCTPSRAGNPICRCQEGLIPKPDTITGCGPECTRDPECSSGYVCQSQRCVEKPDPCNPSPCGDGANCMVNHVGNPICRCNPGLIPKPDTITGCGPECVRDSQCETGYVCQNQRCVEKPDPCAPSPCGPGARCMVSRSGNPICRCQTGLIPKPDTITGCGPECTRDPDCKKSGYVCQNQRCVEKPDPCDPSPCGTGAFCMTNSIGNPICRCHEGLIPKPDTITGCGPQCVRDSDCSTGYVCLNQKCIEKPDPCDPSPCGPGAACTVNAAGNPICRCTGRLIPKPDTITGCGPECVKDPDCQTGYICQDQICIEKPDPCDPSPCGPGTMCMASKFGNPICRCLERLVPKPDTITGCGPECEVDSDCKQTGYICQQQTCVEAPDPCDPNPCGPGAVCKPQGISGFTCACPTGFFGDARVKCTQGECQHDDECAQTEACDNYYCVNPCQQDTCSKQDICKVIRHVPTCGYNYTPEPQEPRETFVIGEAYKPGQETISSRGGSVVGGAYQKKKESQTSRNTFVIGSRHGGASAVGPRQPSRPSSSGSVYTGSKAPRSSVIGASYRRRRRQIQNQLVQKLLMMELA